MPRRTVEASKADWHKITGAQAIARLFPDAGATRLDLTDLAPGRYWPAWEFPERDQTSLDRAIRDIVEGRQNVQFRSREDLMECGISCPYYAWRLHTAYAVNHAHATFNAFGRDRIKKLQDEVQAWEDRIRATHLLIEIDPDIALPSGSLYLDANDHRGIDPQEMLSLRMACIEGMRAEVVRDRAAKVAVEAELNRLKDLMEGRSGANAPDRWRTPFYVYLANLWIHMIDEGSPDPSGPLGTVLSAATQVISNGTDSVIEWGQYRTLRDRFLFSQPGEGFSIGTRGIFDTHTINIARDRGAELSYLCDIVEGKIVGPSWHRIVAEATISLADHSNNKLLLILREIVIKGILHRSGIIAPHRISRLMLQLGWIFECHSSEVSRSIDFAIEAANQGDMVATIVIEVASWTDEERIFIDSIKWPIPYRGHTYEDFIAAYHGLSSLEENNNLLDGNLLAFDIAMMIASAASKEKASRKNIVSGRLRFEARSPHRIA